MNIPGLDYNTQREQLLLPEYGREVQKMIDYAVGLPTKDERQRCAQSIVNIMATKVAQTSDDASFRQTLWNHLYLMSRKALDIDWPCDVEEAERLLTKPQPLKLRDKNDRMPLRHYGRLITKLTETLKTMEPGDKRDELTRIVANQMKRNLAEWGHGAPDDERVANDIARLTDGVIQLDLKHFKFDKLPLPEVAEPVNRKKRKR